MSTLLFNDFDIKLEESLAFLREMVSVNSHSYNKIGVDFTQDIIARKLAAHGLLIELHDDPTFGKHLLARTPVSSSERILLVGHADTVHPADGTFQDFSLDDKYAYGPGVFDMKGCIAMMELAFSLLGEKLNSIPLTVLIVSDEEIGCRSSKNLHYEHAKEAKYALVLEFGRDKEALITSRKGIASFHIQVKGKSAHSGNNYYEGVNAIQEAARIVMELQEVSSREKETTLNVGIFSGGTAINTVPDFAEIKTDLRFSSQEGYTYGKHEIEKITSRNFLPGTEVFLKETGYMPAMPRHPDTDALMQQFCDAGKLHGIQFTENQIPAGGASSGNFLADAGIVVLDAIGPTGSGAHSHDEKMGLASFGDRAKVLAEFLGIKEKGQ
jgi:glutamate carboxypeptidase